MAKTHDLQRTPDVAPAPAPAPAPVRDLEAPTSPVPVPAEIGSLVVGHAEDREESDADTRADRALARLRSAAGEAGDADAHQHGPGCDHVRRSVAPPSAAPAAPAVGYEGGALDAGTTADIERRRGGGRPLQGDTLRRMQTAFGTGLGNVRIHDDAGAASLSRAVSARAFTTGNDIFFGAGEFAPETPEGERVLAHELAHTMQPSSPTQQPVQRLVAGADLSAGVRAALTQAAQAVPPGGPVIRRLEGDKKPGFFDRLFGRSNKVGQAPPADGAGAAAGAAFMSAEEAVDGPQGRPAPRQAWGEPSAGDGPGAGVDNPELVGARVVRPGVDDLDVQDVEDGEQQMAADDGAEMAENPELEGGVVLDDADAGPGMADNPELAEAMAQGLPISSASASRRPAAAADAARQPVAGGRLQVQRPIDMGAYASAAAAEPRRPGLPDDFRERRTLGFKVKNAALKHGRGAAVGAGASKLMTKAAGLVVSAPLAGPVVGAAEAVYDTGVGVVGAVRLARVKPTTPAGTAWKAQMVSAKKWDMAKRIVKLLAAAAVVGIAAAAIASNPVGWGIGLGVIITAAAKGPQIAEAAVKWWNGRAAFNKHEEGWDAQDEFERAHPKLRTIKVREKDSGKPGDQLDEVRPLTDAEKHVAEQRVITQQASTVGRLAVEMHDALRGGALDEATQADLVSLLQAVGVDVRPDGPAYEPDGYQMIAEKLG